MPRIRFLDAHYPAFALKPIGDGPLRLLVLEEGHGSARARKIVAAASDSRELDLRSLACDRRESFLRDFPNFISRLNRANACRDWWAFRLPDKIHQFSRLPRRCFYLSLTLEQIRSQNGGELWIASSDPVLVRNISAWYAGQGLRAAGSVRTREPLKARLNRLLPGGPATAFLRALWRLIRVRTTAAFKPAAGGRYRVMATLFNHQSFDRRERYCDTYFGELSDHLKKNDLSPLIFGSFTQDFDRSLRRIRAQSNEHPLLPMEAFLKVGALLRLLGKALRCRFMDFPLKGETLFSGIEVRDLILEELRANARSSVLFSDLWYFECMRALLGRVRVETLYFPFENRAWERMLTLAVREFSPSTEIVGCQHSSLTESHLNFVLGKGDLDLIPLPDRYITSGKTTLEWMRRGGFPASLLSAGCGLRLLPPRSSAAPRTPKTKRILVLFSDLYESARTLRLLDQTFSPDGPELLLRTHPTLPLNSYLARSGPVNFAYRDAQALSLEQSLDWADTVIFDASTTGLQAVGRGIPAIFLDVSVFLGTDPMPGFSELKWTASTPSELRAALKAVAALKPAELAARRKAAAQYCARSIGPATAENLAPFFRRKTGQRALQKAFS